MHRMLTPAVINGDAGKSAGVGRWLCRDTLTGHLLHELTVRLGSNPDVIFVGPDLLVLRRRAPTPKVAERPLARILRGFTGFR